MADTFTLHGVALSGPTYKVALALALAGQKFSYRHVNLAGGQHKTPEFLKINRFGQVPALQHGAVTLVQSGAILQYLVETLGKFGGRTAAERARAFEWVFWDVDALSPGIFRSRAIARGMFKADPAVAELFGRQAGAGLKALDGFLADRPFLMGEQVSIGDISCYAPCVMASEANIDLSNRPNVVAWMGRMETLPGFKKPYDLLPMNDAEIG